MPGGFRRCLAHCVLALLYLAPLAAHSQRVGVVLSGGGGLGMAHIGVLRALEENGIPVDCITGTSAGALVGAFYAAGFSPDSLMQLMADEGSVWLAPGLTINEEYYFRKAEPDGTFLSVPFSLRGNKQKLPTALFSDLEINYLLVKHLSGAGAVAHDDFDSLFVPYRAVAANILRRRTVVQDSGNLPFAVRASIAVPLVFPPAQHRDGEYLFDGGIYDNFPVVPMQEAFHPDIIIGVDVTMVDPEEEIERGYETNFLRQLIEHNIDAESWRKLPPNGIFISPDLGNMSSTDFDPESLAFAAEQGYQAAMACMEDIKRAIPRRADPDSLRRARQRFRQRIPPMRIGQVQYNTLTRGERWFVNRLVRIQAGDSIDYDDLRRAYLRLRQAGNYTGSFPELSFRPDSQHYHLRTYLKPSARIELRFGGAFFTPTDHQLLASASLNGNDYFGLRGYVEIMRGSFANHIKMGGSLYVPGRFPVQLELKVAARQWNLSKNIFSLNQTNTTANVTQEMFEVQPQFSVPFRGLGKLAFGITFLNIRHQYYLPIDTAPPSPDSPLDESLFGGSNLFGSYQNITHSHKMYPTDGHLFAVGARYHFGDEVFKARVPGLPRYEARHVWFQAWFRWTKYFVVTDAFSFGLHLEAAFSGVQPFHNLTSTLLTYPKFMPLQDSPILYLPQLYSRLYAAPGGIITARLLDKLSVRVEAYYQQRFDKLEPEANGTGFKTSYELNLLSRTLVGSAGLVYDTPVGPVGLFGNYYEDPEHPFRIMLHLGYMIFDRHPWN